MTATPEATAELLALMREMREEMRAGFAALSGSAAGNVAPRGGNAAGGARFGNYGRNKGGPVGGASMADLEYYGGGCRRSLADPAKSRFHDSERKLLAAIEAEIARQGGAPPEDSGFAGTPFDDRPPPNEDDPLF